MGDPQVTVVIPTRDRWPRLESTLRGALAQEGVSLELIVVDDGSTDQTPARLAEVEDSRLRVLRHDSSRGVAVARNAALAQAAGEWIAFLDDDDLWAPQKLSRQLAAAGAAGATWVYSGAVVVDEDLRLLDDYPAPAPDTVLDMLLSYNPVPAGASNVMARADAIREVGAYDETLFQLADWDLWIRLALAGRAASCPERLLAYVQHPGGMLVSDESGLVEEFERLREKYRDACRSRGLEFDRMGLMRWMAWGHSRAGRRRQAAARYLRAGALYARRGKLWASGANLRDAVGVLFGEQLTDSGRRPLHSSGVGPPAWLDAYR
jgi:glycosyltransferase involved in cell wall biosynthesis